MPSTLINPECAYYIKLGKHGEWEEDCLEIRQTIKMGYLETPHELCHQGKWDEFKRYGKKNGVTLVQEHET